MPESTATLPSTGTTNYTSSTPPALANPPATTQAPPATPAQIQQATQVATTPQPEPSSLPDFSLFETARGDLPTTTPQPTTAQVTPPNTVTPPPANATPPATPQQTTAAPQTPPVQTPPVVKPLVDDKGNPVVPEISLDLSQSAINTTQQPQIINPADAQQQAQALPTHENGRDFTGFNEQEREVFRKMANDSFNFLAPAYRKAKQTESQLTALTNEKQQLQQQLQQRSVDPLTAVNPHGYIFTPEFVQITQHQQNAQFENNYWQQQIAIVRSGRGKPRALQFVNGQYVAGQELEPDANTEAWLTNQLSASNNYKAQAQQAEQQLKTNYQQQAVTDLATIKQKEDQFFPWFAAGKQHSFQPVIDSFIKQLPPTQRSNPLASAIGKAYALINYLNKEVNRLKSVSAAPPTTPQNPTGITSGNPSVAGPGANGTINGLPNNGNQSTEITLDAFEAAKRSY